MAGLPKKYAKMGFKKGWKAYKSTKKTTVRTMAKKRSYKKVSTKATKSLGSTFFGKLSKKGIPIAYGFFRNKINDGIANSALGKKIPAFELADEFTMLGINFGLTQLGARKNPIARRALQAMEDIELSNVGEQLEDMMSKDKTPTSFA